MYYILYNTINVKYLKTCSGLQDQRSAGADYNLIHSVLLLYSSLVLIVGSSSLHNCIDQSVKGYSNVVLMWRYVTWGNLVIAYKTRYLKWGLSQQKSTKVNQ